MSETRQKGEVPGENMDVSLLLENAHDSTKPQADTVAVARYAEAADTLRVIEFTLYGAPVAQARARHTVAGGRVRTYDPRPSREFKSEVKAAAQAHVPGCLLTGPLIFEARVYRPIPKGMSQAKRRLALAGMLRPVTRPDLKNYIAGIEDALEGVIYANDAQIVGYGDSGKWYGDPPRVQIAIREIWR